MKPSDSAVIVKDSAGITTDSAKITSNAERRITSESRVTLHFSLALANGDEIDSTRGGDPATFEMGDGSLLPGFERALLGLEVGDDAQLIIEPDQAFGIHREENVRRLAIDKFTDLQLEPGLMVSFAAPDGELPGVVLEINPPWVVIDFNHPLAGRAITFAVSILFVEEAGSLPTSSAG